MVGWHHWLYGHEFVQTLGESEGQESRACCSPWGCKESDRTKQLSNNNSTLFQIIPVIFLWKLYNYSHFTDEKTDTFLIRNLFKVTLLESGIFNQSSLSPKCRALCHFPLLSHLLSLDCDRSLYESLLNTSTSHRETWKIFFQGKENPHRRCEYWNAVMII